MKCLKSAVCLCLATRVTCNTDPQPPAPPWIQACMQPPWIQAWPHSEYLSKRRCSYQTLEKPPKAHLVLQTSAATEPALTTPTITPASREGTMDGHRGPYRRVHHQERYLSPALLSFFPGEVSAQQELPGALDSDSRGQHCGARAFPQEVPRLLCQGQIPRVWRGAPRSSLSRSPTADFDAQQHAG